MIRLIAAIFVLSCTSCTGQLADDGATDEVAPSGLAQETVWVPVKDNLYSNTKGDLGFKVYAMHPSIRGVKEYYLTHFDSEGEPKLADTIDIATFRKLGPSPFYKDKKHIYQYYEMSGGGKLWLFEEVEPGLDYGSFEVLNEFYARDSNRIYDYRNGWIKAADPSTFIVLGGSPAAKDKKGYFLWGSPATLDEISDKLGAIPADPTQTRK